MEGYYVGEAVDFHPVCDFYRTICERQKDDLYGADWHYGIYPSEEDLRTALQNGEVHLCRLTAAPTVTAANPIAAPTPAAAIPIAAPTATAASPIVAAAVLGKQADPMYQNGNWNVIAPADRILTLHLFAVHPDYRGKNLAAKMLEYLFTFGKENGYASIQLDVLEGNIPAEKLYRRCGFDFIEACQVTYEDVGEQTVHLYEKDLRLPGLSAGSSAARGPSLPPTGSANPGNQDGR